MTYTLRFVPEIEEDVINGYVWYEAKSRGLGEDFLRMFYACANEISWDPLLYPKVYKDFRRRSAPPAKAISIRYLFYDRKRADYCIWVLSLRSQSAIYKFNAPK